MSTDLTVREPGVMSVIAEAAANPQVDANKLAALLSLKERIDALDGEKLFNAAFSAMATKLPRVVKRGTKDMGEKGAIPFARWEDIDKGIRPVMAEHGFSLSFQTRAEGAALIMAAVLSHVAGHTVRSECQVAADPGPGRNATQAIGSGRSYAKRYLACDLLNIVTVGEDDDANTAHPITQEQGDQLRTMLDALEPRVRDLFFVKISKTKTVAEIQQWQFDACRDALKAELRKRGAGAK
jgi:hypothetical protein